MFTKILIIDDSNFQLNFLKKSLTQYYSVYTEDNGKDGLETLDREKPDLLVLDNMLKEETGYDICLRIRKKPEYKYLPIVMLSSLDEAADIQKGFESGVNAYLAKSSDIKQLIALIRNFEDKGIHIREEKVLVIDDSPMISAIIERALKILGFHILSASGGEEGIDIALKYKPDVITCDVEMPGINGYETAKRLTSHPATKHIPIIMISSKISDEDIEKGFESGVTEYFKKPFQPEQLASYIEQLLKSRQERRTETILIIEDSKLELNMLSNILKFEGYNIMTAEGGEEALDIINHNLDKIDLILSDIYMPKLSGIRLFETIKTEYSGKKRIPPFMFISIANRHSVAIDCLRLGAADFITKPFDAIELKMRVNNQIKIQELLKHISYKE